MRKLLATVIALVLVGGVAGAARGSSSASSTCTDMSRECVIEVARTYVDAQAGGPGRAEDMRLAADAIRWENGLVTGTSGADIRSKSGGGPSPLISPRQTDRVFVDGNQAFFLWIED